MRSAAWVLLTGLLSACGSSWTPAEPGAVPRSAAPPLAPAEGATALAPLQGVTDRHDVRAEPAPGVGVASMRLYTHDRAMRAVTLIDQRIQSPAEWQAEVRTILSDSISGTAAGERIEALRRIIVATERKDGEPDPRSDPVTEWDLHLEATLLELLRNAGIQVVDRQLLTRLLSRPEAARANDETFTRILRGEVELLLEAHVFTSEEPGQQIDVGMRLLSSQDGRVLAIATTASYQDTRWRVSQEVVPGVGYRERRVAEVSPLDQRLALAFDHLMLTAFNVLRR